MQMGGKKRERQRAPSLAIQVAVGGMCSYYGVSLVWLRTLLSVISQFHNPPVFVPARILRGAALLRRSTICEFPALSNL